MGKGGIDEKKFHLVALASQARDVALLCVLAKKKAKFLQFADQYEGMPGLDALLWQEIKKLHGAEIAAEKIPLVGSLLKGLVHKAEGAEEAVLRQEYFFLRHKLLLKHFVDKLAADPKPVVTTSPLVAFALEEHGYSEQILLAVSDVSRRHVAMEPKQSTIDYLVFHATDREALLEFGITSKRIVLNEGRYIGFDKKVVSDRFAGLDKAGVIASTKKSVLEAVLGKGSAAKVKRKRRRAVTIGINASLAALIPDLSVFAAGMSRFVRSKDVKLAIWVGNDAEMLKRVRLGINKVRLNAEIKKGGIEIIWDTDLAKASALAMI